MLWDCVPEHVSKEVVVQRRSHHLHNPFTLQVGERPKLEKRAAGRQACGEGGAVGHCSHKAPCAGGQLSRLSSQAKDNGWTDTEEEKGLRGDGAPAMLAEAMPPPSSPTTHSAAWARRSRSTGG